MLGPRAESRELILLQVGWKHGETVKELEEARKVKAAAYYAEKKKLIAMRAKAVAQVSA